MIDDREEQAAFLARAKADIAGGLPLVTQCRIDVYRRQHGDQATKALVDAYKRLSPGKQRRASPADALAAKARHEADQATWREQAAINCLEHDKPCFGE